MPLLFYLFLFNFYNTSRQESLDNGYFDNIINELLKKMKKNLKIGKKFIYIILLID
jgi:hypothetical protein